MHKINKRLLLTATLSALLGTAVLAAAAMPAAMPAKATDPAMMQGDDAMHGDMKMTGIYQPYSAKAFADTKGWQRVLFFSASWCPSCRKADADITKNIASIPEGVVVFKTDYDKETALKKQYGITYQHTFVLVNANGKALKKWSGGGIKEIVRYTTKK